MKLAVIGGGVMGANHARVANAQPAIDLVAVVDPDSARAERLASTTGAAAFADVDALLDARERGALELEAAVVAVPTPFHLSTASALLRAGVHVLVEKPLAGTVAESAQLVELAQASGCTVMVGHVERFNAAVAETIRSSVDPIDVEATRAGPFSARVGDSVVLDLMIHDLDIARQIAGGASIARVQAIGHRRRTDSEDMAIALIEFDNGVTATLRASRLSQQKQRLLTVTLDEAVITADLIRQDVAITRVQHVEFLSESGSRYRQTGMVEVPFLENRGEPLAAELNEFRAAILEHRTPLVSVEDGHAAVVMAHRVLDALRS